MQTKIQINKQAVGPSRYGYTLTADAHDADADGYLRPSSILRYLQTAANLQLHTYGPSNEELREKGQAFVLTRLSLDFIKPVASYEELYAETWGLESTGVSFGRCFCLSRQGECVARAQSVWALLDIKNKRPLPVSVFEAGFGTDICFENALPLRTKMPPDAEFLKVGTHHVSYAETDANHHMNNTCYPDMLVDFLKLEGRRVRSIILNFRQEAPSGSDLEVYHYETADAHYFRTLREDGQVNIEAVLHLI